MSRAPGERTKKRKRPFIAAFTDPRKISIAYFQGSIVVDYLFETYGQPGINKLLREFGKGLDSDAALKSALDTDFDRMQPGFDHRVEIAHHGGHHRSTSSDT